MDNLLPTYTSEEEISPRNSLEKTVDEIIDEIQEIEDISTEEIEEIIQSSKNPQNRGKSSTSAHFLDSTKFDKSVFENPSWPSREPSPEPEVFSPERREFPETNEVIGGEDLQGNRDHEEKERSFESSEDNERRNPSNREEILVHSSSTRDNMDEDTYKEKLKPVKLAGIKIEDAIKRLPVENLTEEDLESFEGKLQIIGNKLEAFNDVVGEVLVDLDDDDVNDKIKIADLGARKEKLLSSVLKHEWTIKNRIKEIRHSVPKDQTLEDERKKVEGEKALKLEIKRKSLLQKVAKMTEEIVTIGEASNMNDQKVRECLQSSLKWKEKGEYFLEERDKLLIDGIDVNVDQTQVNQLEGEINKVLEKISKKTEELKIVDEKRALYSLSKAVKENCEYPDMFGGSPGENVYKFISDMTEALTANQVREHDKIKTLMKHLKPKPKKGFWANITKHTKKLQKP